MNNKFTKLFHTIMENTVIKEDTNSQYVFNEREFSRAFKKVWTPNETRDMRYFFRKGITVSDIKSIYREICEKVSNQDYTGAYRAWTKVNTDGFLFTLMWELGFDCSFSDKSRILKFTPHVASPHVAVESVTEEKELGYVPSDDQIKEEVRSIMENVDFDLPLNVNWDRLIKKVVRRVLNELSGQRFVDKDDFHYACYDTISDILYANESKKVNRSRRLIKEDVNLAPHVKKMQGYWKKNSDPQRLIKSIDNPDKLINRWLAAIKIGWQYAAEEFEKAIKERGLLTDEQIAEKKSQYTLDDSVKVPERSKEEERNLSSWVTRSVYLALQKICEERNYKFELKHSKNWNAVTDTGKVAMERNGRAWTCGYELVVTNEGGNGREVHYDLDVVTNEGGGLYGYVWGMQQYWRPTSLKQLIHDMQDSFDVDFEGKKRWGW